MGGSYVAARGELPFGADESEFALDGGFVWGYVAAAHFSFPSKSNLAVITKFILTEAKTPPLTCLDFAFVR